jgi:sugar phosphate isomerase/epimerase
MKRKTVIYINIPYHMVDSSLEKATGLDVGFEIYTDNNMIDQVDMGRVKELSRALADRGIPCTVHAPFMDLSPGGFDRSIRAVTMDKLKKAVEVATILGAKTVVCHPGYDKWRFDGNQQLWLDGSVETWEAVLASARGGPDILLENIFEETPETFATLFRYFRDRDLFFCFDTGHFNLFSTVSVGDWLIPLGPRLRELHLHDNRGTSDDHLPVGSGIFPFRELKQIIRKRDDLIYTSEVHQEIYAAYSLQMIREFLS